MVLSPLRIEIRNWETTAKKLDLSFELTSDSIHAPRRVGEITENAVRFQLSKVGFECARPPKKDGCMPFKDKRFNYSFYSYQEKYERHRPDWLAIGADRPWTVEVKANDAEMSREQEFNEFVCAAYCDITPILARVYLNKIDLNSPKPIKFSQILIEEHHSDGNKILQEMYENIRPHLPAIEKELGIKVKFEKI